MSEEILVSALGESLSEATVVNLKKKVGDYVEQDEMILELESDKVTLEVNAHVAGVITKLRVKEDDSVTVGDVICDIDVTQSRPEQQASHTETAVSSSTDSTKPAMQESPAVRRLVNENNVDTSNIVPSGKNDRLIKADVLNALENNHSEQTGKPVEKVRMSNLRRSIAKRLKDSQNTAAILSTFNEVDMTNVMALRSEYKDIFLKKHETKLGFMSFFIKATVQALKEIPAINAEIEGDYVIYKNFYDLGVAVGTPQGLVVPVIKEADKMSLAELEATLVELGKKAKDGKLGISDMTGGTFTISNGGVYGSLLSTPIINPPQSGILGMHNIQSRPMAVGNEIKIRPMMYLALSYDHRIVDGKEAVTFLVKIKQLIEDPRRLLLDV